MLDGEFHGAATKYFDLIQNVFSLIEYDRGKVSNSHMLVAGTNHLLAFLLEKIFAKLSK